PFQKLAIVTQRDTCQGRVGWHRWRFWNVMYPEAIASRKNRLRRLDATYLSLARDVSRYFLAEMIAQSEVGQPAVARQCSRRAAFHGLKQEVRPNPMLQRRRRIRLFARRAGQEDSEIPSTVEKLSHFIRIEIGDDVARPNHRGELLRTGIHEHERLTALTLCQPFQKIIAHR